MHELTEEVKDVSGDREADTEGKAEQEVIDCFLHGFLLGII